MQKGQSVSTYSEKFHRNIRSDYLGRNGSYYYLLEHGRRAGCFATGIWQVWAETNRIYNSSFRCTHYLKSVTKLSHSCRRVLGVHLDTMVHPKGESAPNYSENSTRYQHEVYYLGSIFGILVEHPKILYVLIYIYM